MAAPRIMIVEDEMVVARQLAQTLEELGYEVASMEVSGEDAVRKAEALKPALILMDIVLQGEIDGIEAASRIRSRIPLPIIYITAYSDDTLLERAKETHPVAYLVKPIRPDELRANIEMGLVRQKMEQRLADSERRYRAVVETQTELICRYSPDGTFTFVNEAYCRYFAKKPEELIGQKFSPMVLGEDRMEVHKHFSLFSPERPVHSHQMRVLAPDGEERWLQWTDRAVFDHQRTLVGFQGVGRDITDQRRAEEALEVSRAWFTSIVENSTEAVLVVDKDGRVVYGNPSAACFLNTSREELRGLPFGWPLSHDQVAEIEVHRPKGEAGIAEMTVEPTKWLGQEAKIIKLRDITDRKQAEAEAEHQRQISESVSRLLQETLRSETEQDVARAALSIAETLTESRFGWIGEINENGRLDTISLSCSGWESCSMPKETAHRSTQDMEIRGIWSSVLETGQSQIINDPGVHPYSVGVPDGHPPMESFLGFPLKRSGETFGMIALANKEGGYTAKDIQRVEAVSVAFVEVLYRRRAQDQLQESEERYRSLFNDSKDGVYESSRDGRLIVANQSFCNIFGYEHDEMIGMDVLRTYSDPADRATLMQEIEDKGFVKDYLLRFRKKDGTEIQCELSATLRMERGGTVVGYRGILRDVSARKQLEAQLMRVQKMESLGTLAGGIAHDFNNLLTVIQGYCELILINKAEEDPDRRDLEVIYQTVKRGTDLVKGISAFSRHVETELRPVDLNDELQHAYKLLTRTIPKMTKITLRLGEGLKKVNADPGQIGQILLNLAVNASHAMPDGGELTIRTESVHLDEEYCKTHLVSQPGEHIVLAVTDTGCGMEPEVVERIFEPFYTTKKVGEGTGLGLSIVFGIVKAHGGHISCYSKPGLGTTFKIYLPVLEHEEESPDVVTSGELAAFGTETILLVDDEHSIRDLGKRMLGEAGYTVLTAGNGKEALDVYRTRKHEISLVMLDLIMPEMGGKVCLAELLKLDPDVKVIISSGFAANDIVKARIEMAANGFVRKPFKRKEILQMVRSVLDGETARPVGTSASRGSEQSKP